MGKVFREGSSQLNMCCASFPGDGNVRRVVDGQKLVDLKMGGGCTESCF